ncbi:MAG: SpaH/EbpB family LPXTG-anchored major pilin [Lactobacillales bacterium]|jgi:hypothetical protein|nr:SpaH/EbpB family LPXTG-anchored major pilin [Lactobacillales bacterium]
MKKFNWKKQATKVGLFCILSSGIAMTTTTVLNNVSIVQAATVDDTSPRSITIHAFKKTDTNGVTRGDGTEIDLSPWEMADKVPAKLNTHFRVQHVLPVGDAPASSMDPTDPTTYVIDDSFEHGTKQFIVTNASGVGTYNFGVGSANDGYYLITRYDLVDASSGTYEEVTADPSEFQPTIVSIPTTNPAGDGFLYAVHLYPKVDTDASIDADKYLDLLNDDGDESFKTATYFAGDTVTWQLDTKLPHGTMPPYGSGQTEIGISDKLNDGLSLEVDLATSLTYKLYSKTTGTNGSVYTEITEVQLLHGDGSVEGDSFRDYFNRIPPIYNPYESPGDTIHTTFIESGYEKIRAYKNAHLDEELHLIGFLDTIINPNAIGKISNEYTVVFNANWETSNGGSDIDEDPDPENPPGPSVYLGGFKFKKTDSLDDTISLAGAEFKLATSQENAIAEHYLKKNADGKIIDYGDNGYDSATDYVAVTGENGIGEFKGLKLTDHGKGPGVATEEERNLPRDYWLSETKAPQNATSGYQLLTEPVKATVTVTSYRDTTTMPMEIANDKKFDLPFTGGAGLAMLIAVAAALIGFAVFPFKKLRKNEK